MEKLTHKNYPLVRQESNEKKIILPGYPTYPDSEDIYIQGKEEAEIDPEKVIINKENEIDGENNEKNNNQNYSSDDDIVQDSDNDDVEDRIGSE